MSETLVWWLMAQIVGLSCLPLGLGLFGRLSDRGYALSKPFALVLLGYLFWILNSVHVLPNSTGGISISLMLLFLASAIFVWPRRQEVLTFAREHVWLIVATEAVLLLTFVTAVYLRSYVPDLGGTEKPMDLMYLNAVTRGEHFPSADAWLSGYTISYYYFGYLLISIMTRLSGLGTGVGYNLGLAMIAALAVTATFGLVYNLLAPGEKRRLAAGPGTPGAGFQSKVFVRPMLFGLAAALIMVVMGNLEGFLEALAAHGFGSDGFWTWVGVKELVASDSEHWYPDTYWFWWHATRILDGGTGIHEFPFFSFLLGDLHPHVMSIPFVLLTVGIAMMLLRSDEPLDLVVWLERPLWLLGIGVILGSLSFINTWDMPTMAFLLALFALVRNRLLAERWSWSLGIDTFGFLAPLFFVSFLAYIPFFFRGFTSQASGFDAVANNGSGLFHTLLLWGPFAVVVLPYAASRLAVNRGVTGRAVLWALAPAALILLTWFSWDLLHAVFAPLLPGKIQPNDVASAFGHRVSDRGWNWLTALAMGGSLGLLILAFAREVEEAKRTNEDRFAHIVALGLGSTAALLVMGAEFIFIRDTFDSRMNTIFKLYYQAWLLLSIASGVALYELAQVVRVPRAATETARQWQMGEWGVAVSAAVGAAVGLWVGPDGFTKVIGMFVGAGIFFVVSAGTVIVWRTTAPRTESESEADEPEPASEDEADETTPGKEGEPKRPKPVGEGVLRWPALWAGGVAVVLLAAFVYPLLATFNRTNAFDLPRGIDGLKRANPDDYAAIQWLEKRQGQPVIAEALGDDYSDGGRISASTGLPTVLQWPGHQLQWRGTTTQQNGRPEDLELLYTGTVADQVASVLRKYGISYVVVGDIERTKYEDVTLDQMSQILEIAFEQGSTTVYRVRPEVQGEIARSSP